MSGKILALEKNTWIQAYHIRNYELGILQKKTPWILSKHINCYYDSKAMGIFNHCMSEKRYFAKSKAMIVQKFRFDKRFLSLDILNFVQWAKNLIDGGWYIMGYYDTTFPKQPAINTGISDSTHADIYAEMPVTELVSALVHENCTVKSIKEQDESLESFYMNLVGGERNA